MHEAKYEKTLADWKTTLKEGKEPSVRRSCRRDSLWKTSNAGGDTAAWTPPEGIQNASATRSGQRRHNMTATLAAFIRPNETCSRPGHGHPSRSRLRRSKAAGEWKSKRAASCRA